MVSLGAQFDTGPSVGEQAPIGWMPSPKGSAPPASTARSTAQAPAGPPSGAATPARSFVAPASAEARGIQV